jgi:hypothetical protein
VLGECSRQVGSRLPPWWGCHPESCGTKGCIDAGTG